MYLGVGVSVRSVFAKFNFGTFRYIVRGAVTRLEVRRSDFDFRQEHFVETAGPSGLRRYREQEHDVSHSLLSTRHSPLVFIEECMDL
jgi:hypothetical protein